MLSKCANPECSAKFRYLRDGKVFRVEPDIHSAKPPYERNVASGAPARVFISAKPSQHPEYFWLCNTCSEHSTVGTDLRGVVLVPFVKPALTARAFAAAAKASAA
jgi:hypothetical protein